MASFAGFNLMQILWCVLYLAGFLVALHQAEDVTFAQKFAWLTVSLTVVSWVVYEIFRLHASLVSSDGWIVLLPRVMVLWIALCSLVRTLLHPDGVMSRETVAFLVLCALLCLFAGLGVFIAIWT